MPPRAQTRPPTRTLEQQQVRELVCIHIAEGEAIREARAEHQWVQEVLLHLPAGWDVSAWHCAWTSPIGTGCGR